MVTITQTYTVQQKVENPPVNGAFNGQVVLNPAPPQNGQPMPMGNQIVMPIANKADLDGLPDAGQPVPVQIQIG